MLGPKTDRAKNQGSANSRSQKTESFLSRHANKPASRDSKSTRSQRTNEPKKASRASSAGATQSRTRWQEQLNAYGLHHVDSARSSLERLLSVPAQSLLTCLVIAIALALPAILYVGLINVQSQAENWDRPAKMTVYLNKKASDTAIEQLIKTLRSRENIDELEYIDAQQGLIEFQKVSGFGDILNSLDENPLPSVIVISPKETRVDLLEPLKEELSNNPIVDSIQLDLQWVARLQQFALLAQRIVFAMTAILGLSVILVIGNIIRLAIASRKDEIVVVKLVGATNAFVRRPFLYTGLWYGLGGGFLALLIVIAAQIWLDGPITRLTELYGSSYQVHGLSATDSAILVFGACVLGSLGAWVAVSRHLAAIKPS